MNQPASQPAAVQPAGQPDSQPARQPASQHCFQRSLRNQFHKGLSIICDALRIPPHITKIPGRSKICKLFMGVPRLTTKTVFG